VFRQITSGREAMNWQDERINLQIERALADVRLTQGCEVEIFVREGRVLLTAELGRASELDTIIRALGRIPGVRSLDIDVAIVEPIFVSKACRRHRRKTNDRRGKYEGMN
jgi:hypothetical protein